MIKNPNDQATHISGISLILYSIDHVSVLTWNLNDHESKLSGIQLIESTIKLIKNLIDVNLIDCSNPIDHESN